MWVLNKPITSRRSLFLASSLQRMASTPYSYKKLICIHFCSSQQQLEYQSLGLPTTSDSEITNFQTDYDCLEKHVPYEHSIILTWSSVTDIIIIVHSIQKNMQSGRHITIFSKSATSVFRSPSLAPVLNQINPVHKLWPYFSNTHINAFSWFMQ
jgi:hypothetical protein